MLARKKSVAYISGQTDHQSVVSPAAKCFLTCCCYCDFRGNRVPENAKNVCRCFCCLFPFAFMFNL